MSPCLSPKSVHGFKGGAVSFRACFDVQLSQGFLAVATQSKNLLAVSESLNTVKTLAIRSDLRIQRKKGLRRVGAFLSSSKVSLLRVLDPINWYM